MKPLAHREGRTIAAARSLPLPARIGLRRAPALVQYAFERRHRLPRFRHPLPFVICSRSTPLLRPGAEVALQQGKVHNVRTAASKLHGAVVGPGAELVWHREVGPPLVSRGFVSGPELREDRLDAGIGGGVCQVANLLFWLGVHSGMEVVERHRHGLDLFPDSQRTVPFGLGATVFFPTKNLILRNPHPQALRFSLLIAGGSLIGTLESAEPLEHTWSVEEVEHRFEKTADGTYRCNRLIRVQRGPNGSRQEHHLAEHRAKVCYPVP